MSLLEVLLKSRVNQTMALEDVKSEDFIEYFIFPDENDCDEESLQELNLKISEIAKVYSSKYIWHRDPFDIRNKQFPSILSNSDKDG